MSELAYIFERLELSQYLENFIEEGFDSWDTVLYITESDLDALNVKLGHRRKLQREIAHARGIPFEQLASQSNLTTTVGSSANAERSRGPASVPAEPSNPPLAGPAKRKYRRHPKPDENAPERPPSAYVIFSNQVREELKPQKLSFTEIAKTVGERWQALTTDEKDPFEAEANAAKEVFNRKMSHYKKTPQYTEYMQYLADFRAKNAPSSGDGKRARLEREHSRPSSGSESSSKRLRTSFDRRVGAGSPIEGAAEASASPAARRPPLPTQTSGSSTSSTSPTNVPGPPPPLSTSSSPGTRTPQLPRIVPLDPRDHPVSPRGPDTHIPSRNVRRTTAVSTPSFLRQDTSQSSVSSNPSVGSGASSSQFTPVTPIEETGMHRYGLGLHSGPILPPLTQSPAPSGYVQSPQPMHHYSGSSSGGTAAPMKRLSLEDEVPERSLPRPRSIPPESSAMHSPVVYSPLSPPQPPPQIPSSASLTERRTARGPEMGRERDRDQDWDRERYREREREREQDRDSERARDKLDPLSVLALAGNMMDRYPRPGGEDGRGALRGRDRPP